MAKPRTAAVADTDPPTTSPEGEAPAADEQPKPPTNPGVEAKGPAKDQKQASGKTIKVKCRQRTPFVLQLEGGIDYGKAKKHGGKEPEAVEIAKTTTFSMPRPVPQNDGSIGVELTEKDVPPSFTWFGGETYEVPAEFGDLDAFKTACATGVLVVVT